MSSDILLTLAQVVLWSAGITAILVIVMVGLFGVAASKIGERKKGLAGLMIAAGALPAILGGVKTPAQLGIGASGNIEIKKVVWNKIDSGYLATVTTNLADKYYLQWENGVTNWPILPVSAAKDREQSFWIAEDQIREGKIYLMYREKKIILPSMAKK